MTAIVPVFAPRRAVFQRFTSPRAVSDLPAATRLPTISMRLRHAQVSIVVSRQSENDAKMLAGREVRFLHTVTG